MNALYLGYSAITAILLLTAAANVVILPRDHRPWRPAIGAAAIVLFGSVFIIRFWIQLLLLGGGDPRSLLRSARPMSHLRMS
jgi:hypothetical protein